MAAGDFAVDVLHVHEDVSTTDAEWAAGESFAETYAEEMAEQVRSTDRLPSSVEAAVDRLESSDLEFVAEHDSDAIALGVSGRSPIGKVLFGSVAQAVILDTDRPVTVVPAHASEP